MHPVQNKLSAAEAEASCQQSVSSKLSAAKVARQKQAVSSNEELICQQSVSSKAEASYQQSVSSQSSKAEASCRYPKQQGGPIPHKNLAQTSDGPPTL